MPVGGMTTLEVTVASSAAAAVSAAATRISTAVTACANMKLVQQQALTCVLQARVPARQLGPTPVSGTYCSTATRTEALSDARTTAAHRLMPCIVKRFVVTQRAIGHHQELVL